MKKYLVLAVFILTTVISCTKTTTLTPAFETAPVPTATIAPTSPVTYVTEWGSRGECPTCADGEFWYPYAISINDTTNRVYVADTFNNRIQVFDYNGTFLFKWGASGTGNGEFDSPYNLHVDDTTGRVYVSDSLNHRVQVFEADGTFVSRWGANGGDGSQGTGDGEFFWPRGITQDSTGNVYVVGNGRVQVFDTAGTYLSTIGSQGSADGQLQFPFGIAIDSSGKIYVADTGNYRIVIFNSSGVFQSNWDFGSASGQGPHAVGIDNINSKIYVAHANVGTVRVYDFAQNFLGEWGYHDPINLYLNSPFDVEISVSGKVFVIDKDRNQVKVFQVNP